MTDLIPSLDGPNLSPFRGAINNIQLQEYLGPATTRLYPEEKPLSYSFRVNIEGKEFYLTVFPFFSLDQLHSFIPIEGDRPADDLVRYNLDPFYAEYRAFGLLEEEGENGLIAVQCHGYISLPQAIEYQMQEKFNINWCRQPEDEKLPLRAILKDYLRSDLCRSEQLCAMRSKLRKLNDMGIFNMNIREENYNQGLLVDFSTAITAPHLRLLLGSRSKPDIFQDMCYDSIAFEEMAQKVQSRNDEDSREAFTMPTSQNINGVSDEDESGDEAIAEEYYRWAAYSYAKVTGRDILDSDEGDSEADAQAKEILRFAAYDYTKVTGRSALPQ
ncbi:kinetochore Sim4 complex subunit FTA2-domain-containing protein [Xylaria curta]|nr:kinetochore Sim4 complex subunit FTA2-domain-containing protein [Xylaria curta]